MMNHLLRILTVTCMLMTPVGTHAQMEVSANLELGYPFLTNKYNSRLLYNQLTPAVRLGMSYKPENTQFFPTLHYAFGRTKLPLKEIGKNVAVLELNYQNLMLSGNFVIQYENADQLYIYGGIGVVQLKNKGIDVSGSNGHNIKARVDSTANIDKRYPAINLGVEYAVGNIRDNMIYISIGANVQYWYFVTNRNNYFLDITEPDGNSYIAESSLTGHAFIPYFYMSLHCMLDREMFRKKR